MDGFLEGYVRARRPKLRWWGNPDFTRLGVGVLVLAVLVVVFLRLPPRADLGRAVLLLISLLDLLWIGSRFFCCLDGRCGDCKTRLRFQRISVPMDRAFAVMQQLKDRRYASAADMPADLRSVTIFTCDECWMYWIQAVSCID